MKRGSSFGNRDAENSTGGRRWSGLLKRPTSGRSDGARGGGGGGGGEFECTLGRQGRTTNLDDHHLLMHSAPHLGASLR